MPPGLQNQCLRDERMGEFDSHIFPPKIIQTDFSVFFYKGD